MSLIPPEIVKSTPKNNILGMFSFFFPLFKYEYQESGIKEKMNRSIFVYLEIIC